MPTKGTSRYKKKLLAASRSQMIGSEPSCTFFRGEFREVFNCLYCSLFCIWPLICIKLSSKLSSGLGKCLLQDLPNLSCFSVSISLNLLFPKSSHSFPVTLTDLLEQVLTQSLIRYCLNKRL